MAKKWIIHSTNNLDQYEILPEDSLDKHALLEFDNYWLAYANYLKCQGKSWMTQEVKLLRWKHPWENIGRR